MTRSELLKEAEKCVCTDREGQYGSPESNFALIANFWDAYLDARYEIAGTEKVCDDGSIDTFYTTKAQDVAIMMALLKIARIATGRFTADSYIDACGYLSIGGEISGEGKK